MVGQSGLTTAMDGSRKVFTTKKETSYSQVKKDAAEYRVAGAQTRITNTRWLND